MTQTQTKKTGIYISIALGAIVFIALMALLWVGVVNSDRAGRDSLPSPLIGKPAPEFALPMLHDSGYVINSKELLGEPYVMNVWGSWCPECRVEHSVITQFALTKRVRVIGYNLKDEPADALRWLEQYGNPYLLVLVDYEGRAAINWGVYGAPETFLVDSKGIIRWKHVGALSQQIIDTELAPLLTQIETEQ